MTTTDANRREPIRPYHIFLLPPEKRRGAWWTPYLSEAMKFDSATQAAAYIATVGGQLDRAEIAPTDADARGLPTYWDNQRKAEGRP
jgi:hypothetical protein